MPPVLGWIAGGLAVLGGGTFAAGAAGAATGAVIAGAVQVAVVAGSFVYQRAQQKKAQAAARAQAARLKKEQARALAEQQRALRELSKLSDFGSPQFEANLTVMIKRSVVTRRIVYGRARVGGIWLYVETTGPSNDFVHLILGLCDGPVEEIGDIYFDDEIVTFDPATGNGTGKWTGNLYLKKYLGTIEQAADPTLIAASAAKWTSAHKLTGIAYLYLRLARNPDVFPGLPEVSAVIKGKSDILDPRTGKRGYTDNCALCLADYMSLPLRGPGITSALMHQNALIHAADVCDQPVALLAGSTERRYTIAGAIDLQATVEDNISVFLQAMAGDVIFSNGEFEIQAGEYRTPTFEITLDMLVAGFTVSHLQPRRDRINVVKGTYVAEANRWQRFDFPAVSRDLYVAQDGQESVRDLTLEIVASGSQAQRLASIELEQSRRARTLQISTNLRAMPVKPGSNVLVTLDRYFEAQPMRVTESTFVIESDGTLTFRFVLVETAPEIYAWDRTQEKQINIPPSVSAKGLRVATPYFSPEPGETASTSFPLSITIGTVTPGATLRYSLTSVPTSLTDGSPYPPAPVHGITDGMTIYARGFKTGYEASQPAIGAWFVPVLNIPAPIVPGRIDPGATTRMPGDVSNIYAISGDPVPIRVEAGIATATVEMTDWKWAVSGGDGNDHFGIFALVVEEGVGRFLLDDVSFTFPMSSIIPNAQGPDLAPMVVVAGLAVVVLEAEGFEWMVWS